MEPGKASERISAALMTVYDELYQRTLRTILENATEQGERDLAPVVAARTATIGLVSIAISCSMVNREADAVLFLEAGLRATGTGK